MIVNAIDPGFRNLAEVSIVWTPKIRRVTYASTTQTVKEMPLALQWSIINHAIAEFAEKSARLADRLAVEEMTGARHGHDDRQSTGAQSDPLLQIQGGIRLATAIHGASLYLVRSQSVNSVLGIKVGRVPGETEHFRRKRQKEATKTAVMRILSGAENLTEHEYDACAIAIACALGKGELQ